MKTKLREHYLRMVYSFLLLLHQNRIKKLTYKVIGNLVHTYSTFRLFRFKGCKKWGISQGRAWATLQFEPSKNLIHKPHHQAGLWTTCIYLPTCYVELSRYILKWHYYKEAGNQLAFSFYKEMIANLWRKISKMKIHALRLFGIRLLSK